MASKKHTKESISSKIDAVVAGMEKANLPEATTEWDKFERLIESSETEKKIPFNNRKNNIWFAIAASITIFIATGLVLNNIGVNYQSFDGYKQITMKDGTSIMLNKNSKLHRKLIYGIFNRNVYLTGEAYFEVKKNGKGFKVITRESEVKVTGTRFNVKSLNGMTSVGVTEGRVEFKSKSFDKTVVLTKGYYSSCINGSEPLDGKKTDIQDMAKWLNKKFVYKKVQVKIIIADIEKAFKIKIILNDTTVSNLQVSGIIEGQTAEDFLQSLCFLISKQYRITSDGYEIY